MSKIQIGYIGSGFNAMFQARALVNVRGVEIAAVYSPNHGERFADYCESIGLERPDVVDSIKALCEHPDVNTISINSPNFCRVDNMTEINQYGPGNGVKNVMCEKPLARNVAEAREVVRRAEPFNTAYLENQIHAPGVTKCRNQLSGVAGPPILVTSAEEHAGPHESWFWDPTRQGGGTWLDMGCHSIAVCYFMGTPTDKPVDFMKPHTVQASMQLLKWGQDKFRQQLVDKYDVDYGQTPAEDYAVVAMTFRNPDTGQIVHAVAINSWCSSAPGLRLDMECMSPLTSFAVNSQVSPASIFISDEAAGNIGDAESAQEKSLASTGRLTVMEDEEGSYGYTDELRNAVNAFAEGQDGLLNFDFGLKIVQFVMSAYLAHEERTTLTFDDDLLERLETYVPAIQQGRGAEVLDLP